MNCLMQKSMQDKVLVNQCVLDSVLWFPLECPRAFGKFDDPVEFKRKFTDNPNAVGRYERTIKGFGKFLASEAHGA